MKDIRCCPDIFRVFVVHRCLVLGQWIMVLVFNWPRCQQNLYLANPEKKIVYRAVLNSYSFFSLWIFSLSLSIFLYFDVRPLHSINTNILPLRPLGGSFSLSLFLAWFLFDLNVLVSFDRNYEQNGWTLSSWKTSQQKALLKHLMKEIG